jgi:hypothetical protein
MVTLCPRFRRLNNASPVNIYCDESGGVGRGVMTLAALAISAEDADAVLLKFRGLTGLRGELKGSRIDLEERAALFNLLGQTQFKAAISVAISAIRPDPGEDRGDHDIEVYGALLNDAIGRLLPNGGGCAPVVIDDGRYGPKTLALVREDVAEMIGPFGSVGLAVSHSLAGLQLADVIANSFFNRALVTERQAAFAGLLATFMQDGRMAMHVIAPLDGHSTP